MNDLTNFLVESILSEQNINENERRNVVVFAGRFQPFHSGHFKVYEHLVDKFGADNVYISTSNKIDGAGSPFNFEQKAAIMTNLYGIPEDMIVQSKQPYKATKVLNEADGNSFNYIIALGKKDGSRLNSKHYTTFSEDIDLKPYNETTYKYVVPMQANGINATEIRRRIRERKKPSKTLFAELGYQNYSDEICEMMFNVLKETPEITNERVYIPKKLIERWVVENQDLIEESSIVGGRLEVDDGPNFLYPNFDTFIRISKERAADIGYTVVQQIMNKKIEDVDNYPTYPNGPIGSVTMFQAGVYDELSPNSQIELESDEAYKAWQAHIKNVVGKFGYSIVDFADDVAYVDDNETINENISWSELRNIDKFADSVFYPYDLDLGGRHFFERLGDPRNRKEITERELVGFIKRLSKNKDVFLNFLKKYKEVVAKDVKTNINIPFMKLANRVIAKTVMRKPNFRSSNPILKFENTNNGKEQYYLDYYKNLSPRNVDVDLVDGVVEIRLHRSMNEGKSSDAKKRYDSKYQSTPKHQRDKVNRNAARRKMERLGKVKKGDGKDVHHKNGDTSDNRLSNLEVLPKGENRAMNRPNKIKSKNNKRNVKKEYATYKTHTAYPSDRVGLLDVDESLMIGYPDQEWTDNHKKRLRKLRQQLDTDKQGGNLRHEPIQESVEKVNIPIPSDIRAIHNAFKKEGKKLYIVGGAIRDFLSGVRPKDYDLATNITPDETIEIANKYGLPVIELGKEFGVVVVNGSEIATFRKDIGKGRRPDSVEFTDIKGDVMRRDLTINALFYDIDRKKIIDLVGGVSDIKNQRVKTVGKAEDRFAEDPLRKLRILRFANRLGSEIDKSDYGDLKANPSLDGVSNERIKDEFFKTIKSSKSSKRYFNQLVNLNMLGEIFPNVKFVGGTRDMVDTTNPLFFVAYLFRDNDVKNIEKYLKSIRYTVDEVRNIKFLIELYNFTPGSVFDLKKMHEVVSLSNADIIKWGKLIGKNFSKFLKFKLSVSGKDVVAMGFKGKEIQQQIRNIETKKYLGESVILSNGVKISKFRELYDLMPTELKTRVYGLRNVPQNPKWHPEGNTLKHTIVVVNRALKSNDIDLAIAAIMHDIGKDVTLKYNAKTGQPTAHGHEKVSAQLVKKHADWIKSVGGNVANVFYIVKNHMRYKNFDQMRPSKQTTLSSFRAFDKLKQFGQYDKGGLHEGLKKKL